MKNFLRLLCPLFCLGFGSVFGQNIQLMISPNPSPYLSDWQSRAETVILVVNNNTGSEVNVKFHAELYDGSDGLIAKTRPGAAAQIALSNGASRFTADDVFPLSAIEYSGGKAAKIGSTGRIPDDNYRLCIKLTDPQSGAVIGQQACKTFNIVAYQAPNLLAPREAEQMPQSSVRGIFFRWTPLVPKPKEPVTYKLQVWEVLPNQNPMNALRSNQPIVDKDFREVLQAQWPTDFSLPEPGKTYIWTITPYNNIDRKYVDGFGFAQPQTFSITPTKGSEALVELQSPENGAVVNRGAPVKFRWTPVVPKPAMNYKLRVWQLMQGQNGTTAMRTNQPIFEKEVAESEFEVASLLTGPCKPPYLCDFIWDAQLMSSNGTVPLGNGSKFTMSSEQVSAAAFTLLQPAAGSSIDLSKPVTFKITSSQPKIIDNEKKLRVWQLMQGQNGTAAMKSNQPIFEQQFTGSEITVNSVLTGPCKPPYLCDFIYEIQMTPRDGSSNESSSAVFKAAKPNQPFTTVYPTQNEKIDGSKTVRMKISSGQPEIVNNEKRLRVWQLMQGQTGYKAMQSNQPIYDQMFTGDEVYIQSLLTGPCKPPYLCDFVYSIDLMTPQGNHYTSPPVVFKLAIP